MIVGLQRTRELNAGRPLMVLSACRELTFCTTYQQRRVGGNADDRVGEQQLVDGRPAAAAPTLQEESADARVDPDADDPGDGGRRRQDGRLQLVQQRPLLHHQERDSVDPIRLRKDVQVVV